MSEGIRTYRIGYEGDWADWVCGTDFAGRQVFLCEGYPNRLTGAFFDADGHLMEVGHRELPPHAPTGGPGWREAEQRNVEAAFAAWRRELELQPGTIEVRCKEFGEVVIRDFTTGLANLVAGVDVEYLTPEDRREQEDWLAEWRENQMYVLNYGKDYWMLGTGEVHST